MNNDNLAKIIEKVVTRSYLTSHDIPDLDLYMDQIMTLFDQHLDDNKRYEGEFKHGKKHGKGSFYLNGDLIYEGTWRFDKPSVFGRSLEEFFCVNVKL